MNSFAFLLLCFSACLVQTFACPPRALSAIRAPCGSSFTGAYNVANGLGTSGISGYGAGNTEVGGHLEVSGITEVSGIVPVAGKVSFGGDVDAQGSVTIAGQCCGCRY